jgi:hypothetical protein
MINDAISLKGSIDAKYANFFLSLLEENKHNELLTDDLIKEFCSGTYEYPDEFSVTGMPDGWMDNEDRREVIQLLDRIENTLSHCLRQTYLNDHALLMKKDCDFNSVFPNLADSILFGLSDERQVIEIEMFLNCWNLLKRVCETNQSIWEETINSVS